MGKLKNEKMEGAIESSPFWLKSVYVSLMQIFKGLLKSIGLLKKLDTSAKKSQKLHYFRSLLAIHQLDDMIALDVPWWTYSAIEAIEQHIQSLGYKPAVFEYGSGASTIWLAKRSDKVISIEHDKIWYQQLKEKLQQFPNVTLVLQPPVQGLVEKKYQSQKMENMNFQNYVKSIKATNQTFDLIIVDGRCREACLEECLAHLKPNGMIIFDNSNRKRYQNAMVSSQLNIQRYYGRVPGSPFKSETAILKLK